MQSNINSRYHFYGDTALPLNLLVANKEPRAYESKAFEEVIEAYYLKSIE